MIQKNRKEFDESAICYVTKPIGHADEGPLWEMTVNQSLFVEDSYKDADGNTISSDFEFYLDAIEYKGVDYELNNLSFENAHSRLWVWQYNSETADFELDYLTSANIDGGYRSEPGHTIICL